MSRNLRVLAVVLVIAALVFRSPLLGGAAFIWAGATLLTAWWTRRVQAGLRVRHSAPATISYGELATIRIEITNSSLLPVPWLQLSDSIPLPLRTSPPLRTAFPLGAGATRALSYDVRGTRRGYYALGPLRLATGDALGLYTRQLTAPPPHVTVFPRVLPLSQLDLPAQILFGPLGSSVRRGEDPARPAGVRPYMAADGVRRLDWKSTARLGDLMVRRAEPSVAPETTLALAFGFEDYQPAIVRDALERAAIASASLGAALLARKLPVGLATNGADPKNPGAEVILPQGKGDGHLQELLTILGRLEARSGLSLFEMLARSQLPWGGTLALIMADLHVEMLPHLVRLRRRGQRLVLLLVEATPGGLALARANKLFAAPVDDRGAPAAARLS